MLSSTNVYILSLQLISTNSTQHSALPITPCPLVYMTWEFNGKYVVYRLWQRYEGTWNKLQSYIWFELWFCFWPSLETCLISQICLFVLTLENPNQIMAGTIVKDLPWDRALKFFFFFSLDCSLQPSALMSSFFLYFNYLPWQHNSCHLPHFFSTHPYVRTSYNLQIEMFLLFVFVLGCFGPGGWDYSLNCHIPKEIIVNV